MFEVKIQRTSDFSGNEYFWILYHDYVAGQFNEKRHRLFPGLPEKLKETVTYDVCIYEEPVPNAERITAKCKIWHADEECFPGSGCRCLTGHLAPGEIFKQWTFNAPFPWAIFEDTVHSLENLIPNLPINQGETKDYWMIIRRH